MTWQNIHGHDHLIEQFRRSLRRGRMPSSFLFVGPPGVGKFTLARKLAQGLLCERNRPEQLDPCGRCQACVQVEAGSHPDLELVAKPADKSFIPVETFIGDREHRMREGLCHRIALRPQRGGYKIAIIDDADYLNQEGANCLLKTLEEPPPASILILIGTRPQRQLPTIRSRCQLIRFAPLPAQTIAKLLLSGGLVQDREQAQSLAELSEGSLGRAAQLADAALWEFRQQLLDELSGAEQSGVVFAKTLIAFVDEAGKEAPPRRDRMRQVIGFAVQFYRQLMRLLSGSAVQGDAPLQRSTAAAQSTWQGGSESAAACLDTCLDALDHVDANANQATLLECWLDELSEITRTGHVFTGSA